MADLKSRYITEDDFKAYWGLDLSARLKSDDNPSNTVNAFLYRIEKRMETFLDASFYRKVDYEFPEFSDYQKEHYKLALLEQAMYVLRNGDISSDSGYDPEQGIKAERSALDNITISSAAKKELQLCGLWCRKLKSRARGGIDYDWLY